MIKAIAEFDREKSEDVNMRVGVHTGTVLCGIVGRRRFKFDVWSNDVTLANKMESSGKPGRVHISQTTAKFLNELYLLEPGELYHGVYLYQLLSCTLINRLLFYAIYFYKVWKPTSLSDAKIAYLQLLGVLHKRQ